MNNWHPWQLKQIKILEAVLELPPKVRSSYGPLANFSDIFISGKNVVFSVQTFLQEMKMSEKHASGP